MNNNNNMNTFKNDNEVRFNHRCKCSSVNLLFTSMVLMRHGNQLLANYIAIQLCVN